MNRNSKKQTQTSNASNVGPNVEVEIHMAAREGRVVLDFVDNGPGIDRNLVEHLFQKGASQTGGGFRLYLCSKIIEVYEGSIHLLPIHVYNKGTAIRIELPQIHKDAKIIGCANY